MACRSMKGWGVVAALALMAFPAFADDEATESDKALHASRQQQARSLAASGKPLDLLAASRLALFLESPDQADEWLEQAIRTGSEQPIIARAAVGRCLNGGGCDIPEAVHTLRTREADEAMAQLLLWQMERKLGIADAAAQAWRQATRATRLVDVLAEGVALLDRATRDLPWPATPGASANLGLSPGPGGDGEAARVIVVFSLAAAQDMPALAGLTHECPADAVAERRQECRRLFTLMADGNVLLMASLGASRMREYSADAGERQAWGERKRALDWIIARATDLLASDAPQVTTRDYLQWMGEDGELPAMQRLLAAHGIAAQPPADWRAGQRLMP